MRIPPQPFFLRSILTDRLTMNLSSQRLHFMSLLNRLLNQCWQGFSVFSRLAAVIVLASAWPTFVQADDAEQFFESQIRPLLIEKCLECHNVEKQSGGLRLDSRDNILKGGDSGAAMIPGDPAASRLIQAIRYDGDLQMPPETPLADDHKKLLTHWIELGAPWPADSKPMLAEKADLAKTHWAFQPVQHFEPPQVANSTKSAHKPVDAFLLARLNAAGLEMSPETDRRTLIRRASYALTGLPPSAQDVEQFVADADPQAYEKLIDRLLASPAHGEQWARHWLDVARYSDTKGYVYGREERFWVHAWNYRDWVVNALNSDMPYDRFRLPIIILCTVFSTVLARNLLRFLRSQLLTKHSPKNMPHVWLRWSRLARNVEPLQKLVCVLASAIICRLNWNWVSIPKKALIRFLQ